MVSTAFSQDSIPVSEGIQERKKIDFQEFFFKAVTHKAINNYQKAIENLEECNEILPDNKAVLFELSKNYYKLSRYVEAIEYAKKALVVEPKNLWISEHLVQVYRSSSLINEAIEVQKEIAKNYPKKKQFLVFLYLQKNDIAAAKALLTELETKKMLSPRLRNIQRRLTPVKRPSNTPVVKNTKAASNESFENLFNKDKSFSTLRRLLAKLDSENNPKLLPYSEQGMTLFPAQPMVYLMNGKAHNKNKNYKKAIESLENGIDFVIDNPNVQTDFYNEFVKSYQGLGDTKNVNKYRKKLRK